MNLGSRAGDKVMFLGQNGYDFQLREAKELLETGKVYTVVEVEVGGWSSYVWLSGFTKPFNTVMFRNVIL